MLRFDFKKKNKLLLGSEVILRICGVYTFESGQNIVIFGRKVFSGNVTLYVFEFVS